MEYKKIDELSISECCAELNIEKQQLPAILENIGGPQEIVDRLRLLVDADISTFNSCSTLEQYERYLASWTDGLHREKAAQRVAQLKAEAEELDFYRTNRNSIVGLKSYINLYPDGKFTQEAKISLTRKKKTRKIRNIILIIITVIITIFVCLINYSPISYLNISENLSFGKRGGNKQITISTDAVNSNIQVQEFSDWISINRDGKTLSIKVTPNTNHEKSTYITVNAYSSFFGKQFNCISKTIKISQSSGLPSYLKTNLSEVIFDKYGNSSSSLITALTDGSDIQISTTASWFNISKNIQEDGDNMKATITLSTGTNNEGSKTGEVIISCNDFIKRVKISQASGLATYFRAETYSLTMDENGTKEGMCYPINIYTDGTSWSVKNAPSWLTATATSNRLEVSVGANSGKVKNGTITIMSNNGDLRDISVRQNGDPSNFKAAKNSIRFGTSSDYEYIAIYNDSHKIPSISEYEYWISTSVIDKNKIKISCDRNYDDPPRSGIVYVSCGDEQISITVKQDGWSKCTSCGGDGEKPCPNTYVYPWTNETGTYGYTWVNGRHVLQRMYTSWTGWMGAPVPQVENRSCSACGGSGVVECSTCKGTGKIKKSY